MGKLDIQPIIDQLLDTKVSIIDACKKCPTEEIKKEVLKLIDIVNQTLELARALKEKVDRLGENEDGYDY